jgi:hypothetical protein
VISGFLKIILISGVSYGIYKWLIENQVSPTNKRWILLFIVFISISLSWITISFEHNPFPNSEFIHFESNIWNTLLISIYILGLVLSFTKLVREILSLDKIIKKSTKFLYKNTPLFLTNKKTNPYSFLGFIIMNKKEFENHGLSSLVFEHEKIHIQQKHSLDNIFLEIIKSIFWFNPFYYLLEKEIKLNHECLADNITIQKFPNKKGEYQRLILNMSQETCPNLVSGLSFAQTKQRFILMNRPVKNSKRFLILALFLISQLSILAVLSIPQHPIFESSEHEHHLHLEHE